MGRRRSDGDWGEPLTPECVGLRESRGTSAFLLRQKRQLDWQKPFPLSLPVRIRSARPKVTCTCVLSYRVGGEQ